MNNTLKSNPPEAVKRHFIENGAAAALRYIEKAYGRIKFSDKEIAIAYGELKEITSNGYFYCAGIEIEKSKRTNPIFNYYKPIIKVR